MNRRSKKQRFKCFLNRFFCVVLCLFVLSCNISVSVFAFNASDSSSLVYRDSDYVTSNLVDVDSGNVDDFSISVIDIQWQSICDVDFQSSTGGYFALEGVTIYDQSAVSAELDFIRYCTLVLRLQYIGDDIIYTTSALDCSLFIDFEFYDSMILYFDSEYSFSTIYWEFTPLGLDVSGSFDNLAYTQPDLSQYKDYDYESNIGSSVYYTFGCDYSSRIYGNVPFSSEYDYSYFVSGYVVTTLTFHYNYEFYFESDNYGIILSSAYGAYSGLVAGVDTISLSDVSYIEDNTAVLNYLNAYLGAIYAQNEEIISLLSSSSGSSSSSSDVDLSQIESYLLYIVYFYDYIDEVLCDILASVDSIDSNLETVISEFQSIYSLVDSLLAQIDGLSSLLSVDLQDIYNCLSDIFDMSYASYVYLNLLYTLLRDFYNSFESSSVDITSLLKSIDSGVDYILSKLDSLDDIVDLLNELIDKLDELELDLSIVDDDSVYQETLQEFSDIVNEYADYEGDVNELLLDLSVSLDDFSVSVAIDSNISAGSESLNSWFDLFMQIPLLSSLVVCSLTVSVVFVFIRRKGDSV